MRWAIWTESIWVYRGYTDMSKICWDQNFDLGFCYYEIENCENFPILDWEKLSKLPNYCETITPIIISIPTFPISMLFLLSMTSYQGSKNYGKIMKKWTLNELCHFFLKKWVKFPDKIINKIIVIQSNLYGFARRRSKSS